MSANKKKLYGVGLLVGLGALLLDRVFLAEPTSVVAAQVAESAHLGSDAAVAELEASSLTNRVAAAEFPRNLPGAQSVPWLRDAFVLTPAARAVMLGDSGELDPRTGRRASRSAADEFVTGHELSAVMTGSDIQVAIVDQEWITVGRTVDGCQLVEITGQTARFQCIDGPAELVVPTRDEQPAGH